MKGIRLFWPDHLTAPPHRDFGHPPKIGFLDVSDDFEQKKNPL